MAWCAKCHYGSELCVLPKTGKMGVAFVPAEAPEKGKKTKMKEVLLPEARCPQCGHVTHEHLIKCPFTPKKTAQKMKGTSPKKRSKDQEADSFVADEPVLTEEETVEEIHDAAIRATGGELKGRDYTKGM